MIITRTPFRISFFGGGTDYPGYYNEHGGSVLSTTINKYCYITCRSLPPFFDHRYSIRYSKSEYVSNLDEIWHPSVRECLRFMDIDDGVEIVHTGDIPAMSGIGSSSSFTVGLLNALYALQGKIVTKRKLALDAIHVEQDFIGENVGSQDQVAAAFGGFNRVDFGGSEGVFVQPLPLPEEKLEYLQNSMVFYFTGFSRISSEIAGDQIKNTQRNLKELELMRQMVDEAVEIISRPVGNLNDFGMLLNESWQLKRKLSSKITNEHIDNIYDHAMKNGALGGKVCGAGGGGFILFFVPPERKLTLMKSLEKLLHVPFRFDKLGTHLIHYSV